MIKTFLQTINKRFLVIHLLACWFIIQATQTFSLLSNKKVLYILNSVEKINFEHLTNNNILGTEEINNYTFFIAIAPIIGWLIALVFSSIICLLLKIKWYHIPLLLAFYIAIDRFIIDIPRLLKKITAPVGHISNDIQTAVLINGSIPFTIALILYFNRNILNYIRKGSFKIPAHQ